MPAWESIGAEVHLVGSLSMGLLMNHRDIDLHLYTAELDIQKSFSAMGKFCSNPAVLHLDYTNLANTQEHCIEWHARYQDRDGSQWVLDMIQILKGSTYEGYFEHIAERIRAVLTPETRRLILQLKYLTPPTEHIMGIEYYQAVLQDGVRTWEEFAQWRSTHPMTGINSWCP